MVDGEAYDGGVGCWVAYSLLHDYHNRPMTPVDVAYATPAGGERVLAAAAALGVPSTRRMARGWRALCAQPGEALVPAALFHDVDGRFRIYTAVRPLTTRPTPVGYVDLGSSSAPLQLGSLCEMGCTVSSDGRGIKCGSSACVKCDGRWRLHRFQGDSAGTFILYNRTAPRRWRCSLEHVHRIASFRRPVVSLDGIANPQTAWGEWPEGPGKTLILDLSLIHI